MSRSSDGQRTLLRGIVWLVAILGVVVLLARVARLGSDSSAPSLVDEVEPHVTSQEQAPVFSLRNFEDNLVSTTDFTGIPLVIHSWAAWCPYCVRELQDLATLQDEFAGRVRVVAINRGEPAQLARRFTDELGVTSELVFLLDPTDSFYRALHGVVMPETLFVSAEGAVQFHQRGPMEREEMRERIQQLMAENLNAD